jgi:hypothetical protein
MSDPASPFTTEALAQLLESDGVRFTRGDDGALYLRFGCDRVPHELRIVVNEWIGYCAISQHDLGLVVTGLSGEERTGEACRLALMLNGEALFGSFMLWGYRSTSLSYSIVLPTADTMLSLAQLQTAIGAVCSEVDACYPLLQRVLWGEMTPEDAISSYRAARRGDDEESDTPVTDEASESQFESDRSQPQESLPTRRRQLVGDTAAESARAESPEALDRIDDAFLDGYDRTDPFSSVIAELLLRERGSSTEE